MSDIFDTKTAKMAGALIDELLPDYSCPEILGMFEMLFDDRITQRVPTTIEPEKIRGALSADIAYSIKALHIVASTDSLIEAWAIEKTLEGLLDKEGRGTLIGVMNEHHQSVLREIRQSDGFEDPPIDFSMMARELFWKRWIRDRLGQNGSRIGSEILAKLGLEAAEGIPIVERITAVIKAPVFEVVEYGHDIFCGNGRIEINTTQDDGMEFRIQLPRQDPLTYIDAISVTGLDLTDNTPYTIPLMVNNMADEDGCCNFSMSAKQVRNAGISLMHAKYLVQVLRFGNRLKPSLEINCDLAVDPDEEFSKLTMPTVKDCVPCLTQAEFSRAKVYRVPCLTQAVFSRAIVYCIDEEQSTACGQCEVEVQLNPHMSLTIKLQFPQEELRGATVTSLEALGIDGYGDNCTLRILLDRQIQQDGSVAFALSADQFTKIPFDLGAEDTRVLVVGVKKR